MHLRHSPDGSTLAALLAGQQLVFHRLPLGTQAPIVVPDDVFPVHADEIVFSPDGSLTYELGDPIVVRNVSDGFVERTLDVTWVGERGVISPDGEYLLTYVAGDRGIVYRTSDGAFVLLIERMVSGGFRDGNVVALGCGKPLEVCSYDLGGVELERVELVADGTLAACPIGVPCDVSSVAHDDSPPLISPAGDLVAAVEVRGQGSTSERFATAWSVAEKRRLWSRKLVDTFGNETSLFAAGGKLILFGDHVLRAADGELLFTMPLSSSHRDVRSLAPDGSTLATDDNRPALLDARTGASLRLFRTHAENSGISSLAINRDGEVLVTNAREAIGFRLADDFSDSTPIWSAEASGAYEVDVSADGKFATLSGDMRLLLDARDGRESWRSPGPEVPPNVTYCFGTQFRFSPDGRWLAGKHHATGVDVFSLADMSLVSRIETNGCARGVTFSPDGAFLLTPEVSVPTANWPPPAERRFARQDAPAGSLPREFIELGPNGKDQIVTGWSAKELAWHSSYNGGPPLTSVTAAGDHPRAPRFSAEGHWVVLGGSLIHLPSGDTRVLDPAATEGLFAPNGDVIVGESDASLARFCRTPGASP